MSENCKIGPRSDILFSPVVYSKYNCYLLYFFFFSLIMKAVITGASGLLGRAVTEQFQNAGWEGKQLESKKKRKLSFSRLMTQKKSCRYCLFSRKKRFG